jgi:hypothetical protein
MGFVHSWDLARRWRYGLSFGLEERVHEYKFGALPNVLQARTSIMNVLMLYWYGLRRNISSEETISRLSFLHIRFRVVVSERSHTERLKTLELLGDFEHTRIATSSSTMTINSFDPALLTVS